MKTSSNVRRILVAAALATACFLAVCVAMILVGAVLVLATGATPWEFLFWGTMLAPAAALAFFCYRVDTKEVSLLFGRWRVPAAFYVYAVLSAMAIYGAAIVISKGRRTREQTDWILDRLGHTPGAIVITIVFAIALVPVAEELFFRRGLYSLLALIRPWVGLIGSALIFAAVHPQGTRLWVFLMGIATAYLYARSRSLWPSVACHSAYNLSSFAAELIIHG